MDSTPSPCQMATTSLIQIMPRKWTALRPVPNGDYYFTDTNYAQKMDSTPSVLHENTTAVRLPYVRGSMQSLIINPPALTRVASQDYLAASKGFF